MCILSQLRIRVVSKPFCVDQLNSEGFNVPNVLIRKTPALFLRGEIENQETNMAEADLSPTTFTSRSASDPDYNISTEDSSENENENTYTEASRDRHFQFIIRPRNRKQCKV